MEEQRILYKVILIADTNKTFILKMHLLQKKLTAGRNGMRWFRVAIPGLAAIREILRGESGRERERERERDSYKVQGNGLLRDVVEEKTGKEKRFPEKGKKKRRIFRELERWGCGGLGGGGGAGRGEVCACLKEKKR